MGRVAHRSGTARRRHTGRVRVVESEHAPAPDPEPTEPILGTAADSAAPVLDLDALVRAERELADVERALARLDAGTYDACETCGGSIGDDRLLHDPTVRTCEAHAPA